MAKGDAFFGDKFLKNEVNLCFYIYSSLGSVYLIKQNLKPIILFNDVPLCQLTSLLKEIYYM